MGSTGITKAPRLLLRNLRNWERSQGLAWISNKAAKPYPMIIDYYSKDISDHSDSVEEEISVSSWIPHPRTGIFFPPGQEAVMADVPDGAASFDMTFWIRNVDGVDKPEHHLG